MLFNSLHSLKSFAKAAFATLSTCVLLSGHAQAAWPERPIQLIVPFPAGSSPDILARTISEPLAKALGTPVIVDNRPGAGGNIGTRYVSHAKPDGYTVLLTINGPMVTAPTLYKQTLGYDPLTDLAAVSLLGTSPNVLIVPKNAQANDYSEFIKWAKANPGALNYGTVGPGSSAHLAMAMLEHAEGIQLEQIPYPGFPQIITSTIAGDLQAAFMVPGIAMPQVEAGNIKALAITSLEPTELLPGLATIASQGPKDFEAISWDAIFVPAGTPEEIINTLNAEIVAILNMETVKEKFKALYFDPVSSTPQELHDLVVNEKIRWDAVIERLNLSLQ